MSEAQTTSPAKKSFFQKNSSRILLILLLIIPLFLSIFLRVQPMYLPSADDYVTHKIDQQLREQITLGLFQQQNTLPPEELSKLVEKTLQEKKQALGSTYAEEIKEQTALFKAFFQNKEGQTYLFGRDPYHYYRYTKNLLERGSVGDELRNNKPFDTHMLAPLGKEIKPSLHPYVTVYVYKIVGIFNPDISLLTIFFLMPVFIMALALVPMFFLVKKFGGVLGGFIAAIILAIHPQLMYKTIGGFSDTDAYTFFLPLLAIWLFIEAFDAKTKKARILFMLFSGISVGLLKFVWTGWWIPVYLITGATCLFLVFLFIKYRQDIKESIKTSLKEQSTGTWLTKVKKKIKKILWEPKQIRHAWTVFCWFFLFSTLSVMVARGSEFLRQIELFIFMPFYYIGNLGAAVKKAVLWPNIYTSITELQKLTFQEIIKYVGGLFFILLFLVGMILLLRKYKGNKESKEIQENKETKEKTYTAFFSGIILLSWFLGMLFTTQFGGSRFMMHLIPILTIGTGITVGSIIHFLLNNLELVILKKSKWYKTTKIGVLVICLLIVGLILGFSPLPPFCDHGMCGTSKTLTTKLFPEFNDVWYDALDRIQEESNPDAILTSWWDAGHWFKLYADRAVTFDGASQNLPQAYWVGRVLFTPQEKEALAILRMLNCGANNVYDQVSKKHEDPLKAIQLVQLLLKQDKTQAEQTLTQQGFNDEEIMEITQNMYCTPPQSFLILSDDMLTKYSSWAKLGTWDFERAYLIQEVSSLPPQEAVQVMQTTLGYEETKAKKIYQEMQAVKETGQIIDWIGPTPHLGKPSLCKQATATVLICDMSLPTQKIRLQIDLSIGQVQSRGITTPLRKPIIPATLLWVDEKGFHEKIFSNEYDTLDQSFFIHKEGNQYFVHTIDPNIGASMFMRLFFYKGAGLKHFTLADERQGFTVKSIQTWNIHWDQKK